VNINGVLSSDAAGANIKVPAVGALEANTSKNLVAMVTVNSRMDGQFLLSA
jgi:hypothetical protein